MRSARLGHPQLLPKPLVEPADVLLALSLEKRPPAESQLDDALCDEGLANALDSSLVAPGVPECWSRYVRQVVGRELV